MNHSLTALWLEQRRRWQRGEPVSVETLLAQQPFPEGDPGDILDLIYNEIALREARGELPQLDDYLARFPQFHEALELHFQLHRVLRPSSTDCDPSSAGLEPPQVCPTILPELPGYEMLEEIGRGGMGVVYRARDLRLKRLVAVGCDPCLP